MCAMAGWKNRLAFAAVLAVACGLLALINWWGWQDARDTPAMMEEKHPPILPWTKPAEMTPYADVDGNHWFLYARQMLEEGRWRIRHTELDNTPYGREVHWSSSYSWWMILLAKARALLTGGSTVSHLAWAGDFGGAILHACMVALFAALFWRRAGAVNAGFGALALAVLQPLASDFGFARPDHHGLQDMTALFCVACMVRALWSSTDSRPGWAVASAFSGATGLWIGATGGFFVLGTMALGGCVWALLHLGRPEAVATSRTWRIWGWAGAAFSLAYYALEYAPGPLPFRLEVNHPLYAIAWAGLGEFVATLQRNAAAGNLVNARLVLAGLAIAQLPATILALPPSWYAPKVPDIVRLVASGQETSPILKSSNGAIWAFFSLLGLVLTAMSRTFAAFRARQVSPAAVMALVAALLLVCFGAMQARWLGVAATVTVAMWMAPSPLTGWRWLRPVAMAGIFAAASIHMRESADSASRKQYSIADAQWQTVRDLGLLLRDSEKGTPIRVMTDCSNPNFVLLHDLAAAQIVGSYFWENVDGLHDTNRFWAAESGEARSICEQRGITHVVLRASPSGVVNLVTMFPEPKDQKALARTMAFRLGGSRADPPEWLEQVTLPKTVPFIVTSTRLYRVIRK